MARVPNLNVNDLPEHYQGDFNRLSGYFLWLHQSGAGLCPLPGRHEADIRNHSGAAGDRQFSRKD